MKKKQVGTRKVDFSQEVQRVWSGVRSGVGATLLLLIPISSLGQCQQTAGAYAEVIGGFVYNAPVTNTGCGYSVPPTVAFTGGGGSGATATAFITNGTVTGIRIDSAGSGYTNPPTIVIEPPIFDLNDTLVGYWPFDGNLNDESGGNINGTPVGVNSFWPGVLGSALLIGSTSYVEFGDPADGRFDISFGEDFSASIWIKMAMSGLQYPMLLTKDTTGANRRGWLIYFPAADNGDAGFEVWGTAGVCGTGIGDGLNNSAWHLLVVTKKGTTITTYVDGALANTSFCFSADYSTSIPLRLGKSQDSRYATYQGYVDEFRLYKRALEPREVKSLYRGFPVITQPKPTVVPWGRTATFSTTAKGNGPMSYQWFKGSQPIAWGTNAVLPITNVQSNDAGFYQVKVSNPAGTVWSQPAKLDVSVISTALNLFPGLMLDGVVGQTYGVQSSTNLSNPSAWVGRTNITLTSQVEMWFDLEPARVCDCQSVGSPARFYRVLPGPISVP